MPYLLHFYNEGCFFFIAFKKVQALCTFLPTHKGPCSYHSFAATDKYIVFIEQPLVLDLMKVISSQVKGRCLYDCMEWQPHLLVSVHTLNVNLHLLVSPDSYFETKVWHFGCSISIEPTILKPIWQGDHCASAATQPTVLCILVCMFLTNQTNDW